MTSKAKFNRSVEETMTRGALREWTVASQYLDDYVRLAVPETERILARRVVEPNSLRTISRAEKQRRRKTLSQAQIQTSGMLEEIRDVAQNGSKRMLRVKVDRCLRSFDAKYLAYYTARKAMKRRLRPHLYDLEGYARDLDPFALEFELAKTKVEPKRRFDGVIGYRSITSFGIHHRARQTLVNWILEARYGDSRYRWQFCTSGRGRDQAVAELVNRFRSATTQYVAEIDIKDFYPSVGEHYGIITNTNRLFDALSCLPRSVIQSSVLSSGLLSIHQGPRPSLFNPTINPQRGIPQGSATSSLLAELIANDIVSRAETLSALPCDPILYVDNFAVTGEDRGDVHSQIEPLVESARSSIFGEFGLTYSQQIRHKREGIDFLGYHVCWTGRGRRGAVTVSVSQKNLGRFRTDLAEQLQRYDRANARSPNYERSIAKSIFNKTISWSNAFQLVEGIRGQAIEIVRDELSETGNDEGPLASAFQEVLERPDAG